MRVWGQAGVRALLVELNPGYLHFAGMTKTQTVRLLGFVLIAIGAALLLATRRWHRRARDPAGRAAYDRRAHLPELVHRAEEPDLRDWVRGP